MTLLVLLGREKGNELAKFFVRYPLPVALKSPGPLALVGSNPTPGTIIKTSSYGGLERQSLREPELIAQAEAPAVVIKASSATIASVPTSSRDGQRRRLRDASL